MSLGCFLRGVWPFVTLAVDGQGASKEREVCPGDSAGVTEKERLFLLSKSMGMSKAGFAL